MAEETTFEKVKRYYAMDMNVTRIANKLGVTEKTVKNYIGILRSVYGSNEKSTNIDANFNLDGEDLKIETLSQKLGIDLNEWEPVNIIGNQWGDNKQLKIRYNKIIPDDNIFQAIDKVVGKLNSGSVDRKKVNYTPNEGVLIEIALYDHHFGKLAHHSETGNNYDLKIAKREYLEAINDVLTRANHSNELSKILFPIGQDLFHVNNEISTTAGGTFQDTDSRLTKIFETVQETLIEAIDLMLEVAPVDIVYVPDNHGPITSYFMCKVIEAYYKHNPNISIDTSNRSRKYYRHGNTLIGMSHGHAEKADTLALTMACEAKQEWVDTLFHEFHLGHFHKKSEKKFNTAESLGDVVIRYLPSLSGTDKWHETKGYTTARKFCECYLYDYKTGPIGSLMYNKIKGE